MNDVTGETTAAAADEHEFTLRLAGDAGLTSEMTDALYEAGCGDSTACLREGRVYLMFGREAATRDEAIASAVRDVGRAGFSCAIEP